MYELILQDLEYQKIMEKIASNPIGSWDWDHGIEHAKRVSRYIEIILSCLTDDMDLIEYGKVCGLLHDIGLVTFEKEEHAFRSVEMLEPFFQKFKIPFKYRKMIKEAILDHSNGENFSSLLGVSLYLADKLDVSYRRVENSTVKSACNQSVLKIKDVQVVFSENTLYVHYVVEDGFEPIIFKEWSKCWQAPYKVAEYLHYQVHFSINDMEVSFQEIFDEKNIKKCCQDI